MTEFEKYVAGIKKEILKHEAKIEVSTRSISRLKQKLNDAQAAFDDELKRGTYRAKIAKGENVKKRVGGFTRKPVDSVPAAAPGEFDGTDTPFKRGSKVEEEKTKEEKSGLGGFFK